MGNIQNKEMMTGTSNATGCKNINMNFVKNGAPVFACPEASESGGTCSCGNRCIKDNAGMCCQSIERIKGKDGKLYEQCIENILKPEYKWARADVLDRKIINPSQPYNSSDSPFSSASSWVSKPSNPSNPSKPKTRTQSSPNSIKFEPCNMADVTHNNVNIPGQQLCDWMNPNASTFKYNDMNIPFGQVSKWYNNPKIYY